LPEIALETVGPIDQVAIRVICVLRKFFHCFEVDLLRVGIPRLQQGAFDGGGGERFKISAAEFGVRVLSRDYLALFSDADGALHRAGGLRQDSFVARSTTAAD